MNRPEHPFAAMQAQMRKPEKQGGGFASLTEQQKWEWHADVYAFRRAVLGIRPERGEPETTPPDPHCEWLSAALVERAEAYYRERHKSAAERRQKTRSAEQQLEGRDIVNRWVQSKGFTNLDVYCAAKGGDELAAHKDYLESSEFREVIRKQRMQRAGIEGLDPASPDYKALATMLGLKVTENKFDPTPEEMAASRRQLGLDPPAADGAAA
jgi:hypothetical protein